MKKRLFTVLLMLVLCVGLLSVTALADGDVPAPNEAYFLRVSSTVGWAESETATDKPYLSVSGGPSGWNYQTDPITDATKTYRVQITNFDALTDVQFKSLKINGTQISIPEPENTSFVNLPEIEGIASASTNRMIRDSSGALVLQFRKITLSKDLEIEFEYAENTAPAAGVHLDKTEMTVYAGGAAMPLTATVEPYDARDKSVTWTSSAPEIAAVDESGIVTGVSAGTAVITATTVDGGFTASCTVTVKAPPATIPEGADASGDISATGSDYVLWWIKDGVLTISGTGAMVSDNSMPWSEYAAQIKSAVIEEGVSNIGSGTFRIATLESVNIPSTVTSIDANAFSSSGLKTVTLPETITSVGNSAFSRCTALISANINCNISGNGVFSYCTALTTVNYGEKVTAIGRNSFSGDTALTNVSIPNGLIDIGDAAFKNTAIKSIVIPAGVKSVLANTFSGCGALETVTFSEGLETIEQSAFQDCISLTQLVFPSTLTAINRNYAFQNCVGLKEVVFSKNLTLIGNYSFKGCSDLETVTLYDKLMTVADNAFSGCTKLATVNFHGTEEQWAAVDFTTGNEPLTAATVNYILFANEKPVVTAAVDKKTGKIKLTIEPLDEAVGYKVFVATAADGEFELAAETDKTTYTYNGKAGTKYYFKVQAVNEAGETSAESELVNKVQVPAQVTSLKATTKKGQVTLKWKKVTGAKKYVIYMSKNGKSGWKKVGTATKNTFVYKKGKVGTKLYFKVQALTANNKKGEFSKVVSIKVKK